MPNSELGMSYELPSYFSPPWTATADCLDNGHGALPGRRGTACHTPIGRSRDRNEEGTAGRTPTRATEPGRQLSKVKCYATLGTLENRRD